jgi:tetratricopeptide (TPR) repeat protein
MIRKTPYLFVLVAAGFVLMQGCTTKRDGRAYRVYHNTHAKFNGFFYASEALAQADKKIKDLYEPNWDEVLPLFLDTDSKSAQQVYPLMERAIEKSSKVVDKHTLTPSKRDRKYFKRPEMNKWIDDNYTVIGKAYYLKEDFAKSEEIFLYLARTVDTPDAQASAFSWLGRIYIRTGDPIKAKNMLAKAEQFRDASTEVTIHTKLVLAQYNINEENYEAAVRYLKEGIDLIKKKKDKARPLFILAQCLREAGDSEGAIEVFNKVVDLRTPYELEFQAKIQQAMTYERVGGNSAPIVELLEDMLDDDKNADYLDQVYYALGEVALEDRRRDEGIDLLESSIYTSTGNSRQLGKGYLRLADLHMEDLHYETAQSYYDSALVHMPADNHRKEEVENLASNLTDLVVNLRVIEEQDSLLQLCELDEIALLRFIEKVWDDMAYDLESQRFAHEEAKQEQIAAAGTEGEGMFWPYNGVLRISGSQNFQDYWGDRPLEDHWRRRNKISQIFSGDDEASNNEEEGDILDPFDPENLPSVEEMLAELPCEEDERAEALEKLAEAYYLAGLDYREKLADTENAIDTWLEMFERLDTSAFHPTATYQLFRTYLQRELEEGYENPYCETCNSEYWASQIVGNYPGSEWALLIENPDYLDAEEEEYETERIEYEAFLTRYYNRDYQQTLLDINKVLAERAGNPLECMYILLRAQCIGGLTSYTGDRAPYYTALEEIVSTCPDTEQEEFARSLLQQLGVSLSGSEATEEQEKAPISAFALAPSKKHYFAVLVPVSDGKGDYVKAQVSDFNTEYFNTQNLRVTSNLLNRTHQIVLIKTFSNHSKGMDFFNVFTGNRELLIEVNSAGYTMFLISSTNYIELFKNKDIEGYTDFFNEHYLSENSKQAP